MTFADFVQAATGHALSTLSGTELEALGTLYRWGQDRGMRKRIAKRTSSRAGPPRSLTSMGSSREASARHWTTRGRAGGAASPSRERR